MERTDAADRAWGARAAVSTAKHVIIAGAGPVGLSCALFLVARGVSVTVLEAEPELPTDMRASTFHPATLDMLTPSGIAARLVAQGVPAPQWQFMRRDTGGAIVFDLGLLSDVTAHPYRLQCEQFKLTRLIVEALADDPRCTIVFGASVAAVTQDADGVTVQAQIGGTPRSFRGAWLIGADGAHSLVRGCIGEALHGETYPLTSLTVSVDFPFQEHLAGLLNVNYVWTEGGHFSLMRVQDGWRVGYSPPSGLSIEEARSEAVIQRQLQVICPTGMPYRIMHRGAYTVHRRLVDRFRVGRVLLAGDAAHLNSPVGGMGMNSGIHDAANLADKLARVLDGADDALLDRYARQRRAIAAEDVQAQSDANFKRHRETDTSRREAHWAEMQATVADPERLRRFLLNASMIASVRRAEAIA
jgi:3-(3-hydroxy-phenyl)propionate hydroxylase